MLEQHRVAGGNSHVFRRQGFEFDVGVHYLGDCGPDGLIPVILRGLGAADRVSFRPIDPDCFDRIMLPEVTLDVPADWSSYRDRLSRALPGETTGLDTALGVCRTIANEQRAMLRSPGGAAISRLLAHSPATRTWGRRTLAELFTHCGLSPRARTLLAAQSPNYGAGPAVATVATHAVVLDHYLRGAYVPRGGEQMLASTLIEVLRANDGELRTGTRVTRISVRRGQVTGVHLADGSVLRAPVVVSNADYRRTVLELVGPEHFQARTVAHARAARMGLSFAMLYLGLRRELPGRSEANIWWYDTDDIDGYYAQLDRGEQLIIPVSCSSRSRPARLLATTGPARPGVPIFRS